MYTRKLNECLEVAEVGGKGANLGKLVRAGFAVPDGFVVTTEAYRAALREEGVSGPGGQGRAAILHLGRVSEEILAAYLMLGGGAVAVRSSATAEDMAAASMAGQYETFLDVRGERQLLEKIAECWASLDSPRTRAYLAEHGIDHDKVAMGVVVQRLVPADVAGVLFTIHPNGTRAGRGEMLIEASWGLGESVVSGKVQPDVVRIDAANGNILEMVVADKRTMIAAQDHQHIGDADNTLPISPAGECAVDDARRKAACLAEPDTRKLWELGKRAADHFGGPQDIEWAISRGELFLLQSRPITTHLDAQAREQVTESVRDYIAATTLPSGRQRRRGPWVLHNLAETLPHPTPLTWSVIQRFMCGAGGFGNMYRMAGFEPGPEVCRDGFLDLLGGRIYMDASRAPEMFFEKFPFAYDVDELKHRPDASQTPPTLPRGSLRERMQAGRRLGAVNTKLKAIAETFDRDMREEHVPAFKLYVEAARGIDLRALSAAELVELWQRHEKRVMDDFGPLSLLPSLICGMALGELRGFLEEHLWEEDPDALSQMLSAGGLANRTVMADAELYDVGLTRGADEAGSEGEPVKTATQLLDAWVAEHGHRGVGEFDLAAPRWRERPDAVLEMAARLAEGERPLERHRRSAEEVTGHVTEIRTKLDKAEGPNAVAEFDSRLELVRRYMPWREDGKDYFMMGYGLLRSIALEIGRRLGIGEDVFYLTRGEMLARGVLAPPSLSSPVAGTLADPSAEIELRKQAYRAEAKVVLPHVIENADTLGGPSSPAQTPHTPDAAGSMRGFAISGGSATGKVRVLRSPTAAGVLEKGYILVCPSTDPSWTPLFVNAAGLVLEVGGVLSHGAVVAREMGLPAVVVADATRLFKDGDEIVVDGTAGWVGRGGAATHAHGAGDQPADPADLNIARQWIPPVAGLKDRRAGKIRNVCAAFWALFVAAFFLLPYAWVHGPTLVFLDHFLWPLVRAVGKPWTVAIVAAVIAVVTLTLQKLLTDNRRLLEAKRRAAVLLRQAQGLPSAAPRRRALQRLASPVQARVLLAALVPVGILLGPMVLPFAWFKDRVDPAAWNAPAGTPVEVVAYVDSDWAQPVTITAPAPFEVDGTTPIAQSLSPVRRELEHLLALYQSPDAASAWEVKAGPDVSPALGAAELKAYLDAGVPAQALRWRLVPAANVAGKFPLTLSTGKFSRTLYAVLGDDYAPSPAVLTGGGGAADGSGPIKEVRISYGRSSEEKIFWRPFGWMAGRGGFLGKMGAWDTGWVWTYILAYLPILFGVRWAMRVA